MEKESFQPIQRNFLSYQRLERKQVGFWQDAWYRFRSNKGALLGAIFIICIMFFAFFGSSFSQYDYYSQNLLEVDQGDSAQHYFGTDSLGRDLWARTWYGAKISLLIAFLAVALDVLIGVTFGGISGYFGGRVDDTMQRVIEILYSIPNLIVIILMLMWLEPGIIPIAVALSITGWVPMARIVRAQVLKLKSQEFVLAARSLGASHRRIFIRHLLPNTVGPIIISVSFSIPSAIFFEAFLSFIGLGLRPPQASLGVLVNEGYRYLQLYPHQLLWPALLISLIMLGFNLMGDGLRDALDPKMKR
ncbi:oligopeptide transport system permease protein [Seinonella peptonophila]|uniref:Oligopeptide transport system permease protein n=1 Tax=Seinonella peptonophila TaxID=112248 RepID=A0A1M4XI07_9BACL|nr:ABC transporter permease [Seinonella peptonophila]SHE93139.1 oligopeptide transport system permease protein [Seinonella peptonophila]